MMASNDDKRPLILLTGATGYVGGRLIRLLEERGDRVRCLARRPENLRDKAAADTQVVAGDLLDAESLVAAMAGVHTAYYLVHSMGSSGSFELQDRAAARNFGAAARAADVRRIVYLGGLGESSEDLSPHLRSRHEVGEVLRSSGVEVIEFRASIVIGSGSLSFEMIRALVERLPIMIAPRWVSIRAQPIAIGDLLAYLLAALDLPADESRVFEIGGSEPVSYGELMREYARQRGLRRLLIPVPVLTPRLSSLWLGLVTPLYARVGRKLIDSIRHPTVVHDSSARSQFAIEPVDHRAAIAAALRSEDRQIAETRWSDALSSSGALPTWFGVKFGSRLIDSRVARVDQPPARVFARVRRIGGEVGWYYGDWLWRLRGLIDLLVGGVGLRRGRRDPEHLCVGDTIDWWRVEAYEPDRRLRLAAEMKLPGRAWLEYEVEGDGAGATIRQTAIFDPVGVIGRAYWYLIYPLHQLVFRGMLRGITGASECESMQPAPWPRRSVFTQCVAFGVFLTVCFGTAAVGAWLTSQSVGSWYRTLAKPSWTPPDWLFGPVWSSLYLLMASAGWLVWRKRAWPAIRFTMLLFAGQLALNALWSGLFFALRAPAIAFAEILVLWLAIGATTRAFWRVSQAAGWLLLPYLAWSSFAAVLNLAIWRLNS